MGHSVEEVSSWAEQYRPVWEARLDRMDAYLRQLRPDDKDAYAPWPRRRHPTR